MKSTDHRPPLLTFSLVCSVALMVFAAGGRAQSSAFTFQGRLNDSGAPASGNYDIQLKLFNTATVGTGIQIGATINFSAVPVTSGVFTVQPDFTAAAFPGADRFVEVGVKPAGSADPLTILTPRQPITPTPYALHSADAITATSATNATNATNATSATTATNATQLGGIVANNYVQTSDSRLADSRPPTPGSANYIQNTTSAQTGNFNISGKGTIGGTLTTGSNIGIGTTTPSNQLDVNVGSSSTGDPGITIQGQTSSFGDIGLRLKNTNAGNEWYIDSTGTGSGYGAGKLAFTIRGGVPAMTLIASGNVGIGTTAPLAKLDVRGDVKLGSTGQLFAPGGEENLRIIRGTVDAAEHIDAGSGFTVSLPPTGSPVYTITFTTPFSGVPTVTANCDIASAQGCFVMTAATNGGATIWAKTDSASAVVSAKFHFIAIGPR